MHRFALFFLVQPPVLHIKRLKVGIYSKVRCCTSRGALDYSWRFLTKFKVVYVLWWLIICSMWLHSDRGHIQPNANISDCTYSTLLIIPTPHLSVYQNAESSDFLFLEFVESFDSKQQLAVAQLIPTPNLPGAILWFPWSPIHYFPGIVSPSGTAVCFVHSMWTLQTCD